MSPSSRYRNVGLFALLLWLNGGCGIDSPQLQPVLSDHTPHFTFVKSEGQDDVWKLMEWKLRNPKARVINILPITQWTSTDLTTIGYGPAGFVLYYLPLDQPVTQLFARVEGSEESFVRFGMDALEDWQRDFPTADLLAVAALPMEDNKYPYLVCFEMPPSALPDSLLHYYQSIPVEPSEFTPLTDANAPMTETTLP